MSLLDGYTLNDSLSLPSFEDVGILPASSSTVSSQPSIFGQFTDFGKDLLSGYFDLQGQRILLGEQTKLAEAQAQQASLLGVAEQPQNVDAVTLDPSQLALLAQANSGGGGNGGGDNRMLTYAFIALALYMVVK